MTADNRMKVFDELGFIQHGETDTEIYGTCPFCAKARKFYINVETMQWDCKGGDCLRSGNLYSFIAQYYEMCRTNNAPDNTALRPEECDAAWSRIADDRGMPIHVLWDGGVAFDLSGKRYLLPVHNRDGAVVNLRHWKPGGRLYALPGLQLELYNLHELAQSEAGDERTVYICEGEWDVIAMRAMLSQECQQGIVVGIPGAGTFKDIWVHVFRGKRIRIMTDADDAGITARERICTKLDGIAKEQEYIEWPDDTPDKFDVRDFYRSGFPLSYLFVDLRPFAASSDDKKGAAHSGATSPPEKGAQRPPFKKVIETYKQMLNVDDDYETAIRVAYAVYVSQSIQAEPLWVYLVGPPSSGKTVLIQSLMECDNTVSASTLTPRVLVSGWRAEEDPSLLPKLNGKTFLMKDFTEVLNLPRIERDEIYAILRGAYDGVVEKPFGNGVYRYYEPHFSFLAGVTPNIYAERSASLGERFLMLHILKGTDFDTDTTILAALSKNSRMSHSGATKLAQAARDFLEVPFSQEEYDVAEDSSDSAFHKKLAGLAQLVAMLRGQVQRDFKTDNLLYRPQFEVGARLAKQLNKLAVSLAMLEDPIGINDRVYEIVTRVAFDTCIGFNLEIASALSLGEPLTVEDFNEITGISKTTLRTYLADMLDLGVITRTIVLAGKPGMPDYQYYMSDKLRHHWDDAGFANEVQPRTKPSGYRKR